jgi:hypothetical protein
MDLHPDFRDLLSALAASNAEYLIVGGWAVALHGEPRFTKDLDLLVGTDPENLLRVASAFREFGAPPEIVGQLERLAPEEFLFLGAPPARVDVLRTIPGIDFREAYARRSDVDWEGVRVHVVARDDLIASKRAAGRERDLRDVRALERAAKTKKPSS